ncbi:hypothetical protein PLICRDRAFT_122139 [Plicaturopsis crispa FD-325 SS-3]|nr:hypothetical protein PLICRDRAFT_122139 [Plicaturopsis crispa FD-325 SS-3]
MSTFSELEATSALVLWNRSLPSIVTLGGPIPRNLSDSKHTDESNSRTYLKVAMAKRFATSEYFRMVSTRPHGMAKTDVITYARITTSPPSQQKICGQERYEDYSAKRDVCPKKSPTARTWGSRFDPLPSESPPSTSPVEHDTKMGSGGGDVSDAALMKREEKMPHDSSVFVGSLPPGIEQPDLVRMLTEHLSSYTEIKSIKVVRDSKGGVCAFLQCEDAPHATVLIDTLHASPPPPFVGRYLRFERARAFRTLLISYRTPMQYIPGPAAESSPTRPENHEPGRTIKLDLATDMKLWRPRGAKYLSILYNADARDCELKAQTSPQIGHEPEVNIFLSPVVYNEETIRKIAGMFGPIDEFHLYLAEQLSPSIPGESTGKPDVTESMTPNLSKGFEGSYPSPHDSERSAGMDPRCWEVKWDHRDDAVSALMTLRRVPHLTVTWAHQASTSLVDHQSPNAYQTPRTPHPNSATYPFHIRGRTLARFPNKGFAGERRDHSDVYDAGRRSLPSSSPEMVAPFVAHFGERASGEPLTVDTHGSSSMTEKWRPVRTAASVGSSPLAAMTMRPLPAFTSGEGHDDGQGPPADARKVEWTEADFPPLVDMKGRRIPAVGSWASRTEHEENERAMLRGSMSAPLSATSTPTVDAEQLPTLNDDLTPPSYHDEGQEVEIPATPEFGLSPYTPKTSGSTFPRTPGTGSYTTDFRGAAGRGYGGKDHPSYYNDDPGERELDPTTIFVGGLEMYGSDAWDEEKITKLFAKYGAIESVKFIRPVSNKSAFAFVKYLDTKSSALAVQDQHNRIYNGRQMRVQIRDCNPPSRGGWKGYSRGRGRLPYYGDRYSENMTHNRFDISGREGLKDPPPRLDIVADAVPFRVHSDPPVHVHVNVPEGKTLSADAHQRDDAVTEEVVTDDEQESQSPAAKASSSSPEPSVSQDASGDAHHHEWMPDPYTSASFTPPTSSLGSSASATAPAVPFPLMNATGYYPPPAWMQQYPQHYPYPMYGYPGYPMPPHHGTQVFAGTGGSEAGSAAAANPWAAMGNMYTPYVPPPGYAMRAANPDQAQAQPAPGPHAPLAPTGFIHGDQGTLIPVYAPDALNNYMSGGANTSPNAAQAQSAQATALSTYRPYTQSPVYPYIPVIPSPAAADLQSNQVHRQAGWVPNHYRPGFPVPQHHSQPSPTNFTPSTFSRQQAAGRGLYAGMKHGQQRSHNHSAPQFKRHGRGDTHPRGASARYVHADGILVDHSLSGDHSPFGGGRAIAPAVQYGGQGDWNQQWAHNA